MGAVGNSSRLGDGRLARGGRGKVGNGVWAGGLPVEGAGAVEKLEVEGGRGLAVDFGVGSGHGRGLVVVMKLNWKALG